MSFQPTPLMPSRRGVFLIGMPMVGIPMAGMPMARVMLYNAGFFNNLNL
jgi:hypothetical protein